MTPESSRFVAVFQNPESGVRVVRFQILNPESGVGVGLKFTDSAALLKHKLRINKAGYTAHFYDLLNKLISADEYYLL